MNIKAFELVISTLILIILGIAVLIGLIYALTNSFEKLNSSTKPLTDTNQATVIKLACEQACNNSDRLTYCCNKFEIEKQEIKCTDSRLELDCEIDCSNFDCDSD